MHAAQFFFQSQPWSIEYTRLRIEVRLKIVIEPAVSFGTDYSDKGSTALNQLIQRIEQAGEMFVEKKVALRSVCSWTISREHSYICLNNPPTTPRFLRQNQRESRPRNIVAALRPFRHWKGILKKVLSLVAQRNDRPTSSLKLSSITIPNLSCNKMFLFGSAACRKILSLYLLSSFSIIVQTVSGSVNKF